MFPENTFRLPNYHGAMFDSEAYSHQSNVTLPLFEPEVVLLLTKLEELMHIVTELSDIYIEVFVVVSIL